MTSNNKSYTSAFVFLTTLFFCGGLSPFLVDPLIPRLKEVFELTNYQSGLIQFSFFGAYFLLSIPAGFILSKIGYKKGIVLGWLIMSIGCLLFYPAASSRIYIVFLFAVFILASGMTVLQVAANPYVAALGPEKSVSSRLNFSQAFNSVGTAIAPAVGAMLILSDDIKTSEEIAILTETAKQEYFNAEASAVQLPFLGIAGLAFLLALIFVFVKLPKILNAEAPKEGYATVWKNKYLRMGALGIFVYVGAEVSIGSYLVDYFLEMKLYDSIKSSELFKGFAESLLSKDLTEVDNKATVGAFVTFYWSAAMIGRFIGAYLTKIFKPGLILVVFAVGAISMVGISMSSSGFLAMGFILAVGLFNSIMFPTIFTLAIDGLDDLRPQASGILCTMIVGGAS